MASRAKLLSESTLADGVDQPLLWLLLLFELWGGVAPRGRGLVSTAYELDLKSVLL